jgi:hypothetical protein
VTGPLDRPSWAQVFEETGPITSRLDDGTTETYVVRTYRRSLRRYRLGELDVEIRVARVDIIRSTLVHRGVASVELVDRASHTVVGRLPLEDLAPFLGELNLAHLHHVLFRA